MKQNPQDVAISVLSLVLADVSSRSRGQRDDPKVQVNSGGTCQLSDVTHGDIRQRLGFGLSVSE